MFQWPDEGGWMRSGMVLVSSLRAPDFSHVVNGGSQARARAWLGHDLTVTAHVRCTVHGPPRGDGGAAEAGLEFLRDEIRPSRVSSSPVDECRPSRVKPSGERREATALPCLPSSQHIKPPCGAAVAIRAALPRAVEEDLGLRHRALAATHALLALPHKTTVRIREDAGARSEAQAAGRIQAARDALETRLRAAC